jgi:uncharacterized protein with PIN domain
VAGRLPPQVLETQDDFRTCDVCGRVYWKGSHWERMSERMSRMLMYTVSTRA